MGRLRMGVGLLIMLAGVGIYACPLIRELQFDRQVRAVIRDFEERYRGEADYVDAINSSAASDADAVSAYPGDFRADEGNTDSDGQGKIAVPDTENGSYGAAGESELSALYSAMLEYNENLLQNGQSLTDAWSYQQEPINLTAWHIDDNMVGYIEIPDMEVLLPLYLGASAENLAAGAAVLSQTSLPIGGISSNCVIAGHRGYGGMAFFREIESLREGSRIYIVNPWETLVYQVMETKVIDPSDIGAVLIQEGRDLVTLITCHPYLSNGLYRYVVYCERTDGEANGSAKTENRDGEANIDADGTAVEESGAESGEGRSAGSVSGRETADPADMRQNSDEASAAASSEGLIRMEKELQMLVPVLLTAFVCILLLRGKSCQKLKKHEK